LEIQEQVNPMKKMKHWAMQYDHCKACGTTDKPHHGLGLCITCYHQQYVPGTKEPTQIIYKSDLEPLAQALPQMFKAIGITGYAASYNDGKLTIKKLGTKLSASWPE
jgi:hypothetical protein